MVQNLYFFVEGIRGAIPLDESMFLVRMVMMGPASEDGYGIAGTINLHGTLIPVYSLRKIFGFSDRTPRLTDNLIIKKLGTSEVALWVDETFVVRDERITPIPDSSDSSVKVIPGMTVMPDGLVIITDIENFLNYHRINHPTPLSGIAKGLSDSMMTDLNAEIGSSDILHDDQVLSILKKRAVDLAQPEEIPHEYSSIEVLKFQLVYQEYAVDMKYVRESVLSREITPVPGAPDHILGVLPVRGEIIPLIDLRILLSILEKGLTDLNHVIVMTDGVITFGILADQITGISSVPQDQIGPPDPMIAPRKPVYILGIAPGSLVVINAGEILSDPDMIVDHSREHTICPTAVSSCRELNL